MNIDEKELVTLLRLHNAKGYGDRTLHKLLTLSTDLDQILSEVTSQRLFGLKGIKQITVPTKRDIQYQIDQIHELNIRVFPVNHEAYPEKLHQLYDPPPILYVRGKGLSLSQRLLAVVGTRNHTEYGRDVVYKLLNDVVNADVVIVSGMALGIDTFAHTVSVQNNKPTIAVLGSGVDVIAPVQNTHLYEQILQEGSIVSEFVVGTTPAKYTFPQRNRIIAALSDAVLIVEAGEKSGALITADFANDLGRDVLVVPGNITSTASVGSNKLIRLGAQPVLSPTDVLDAFDLSYSPGSVDVIRSISDPLQEAIAQLVSQRPRTIDAIIEQLDRPSTEILHAVSELELLGVLKQLDGGTMALTGL